MNTKDFDRKIAVIFVTDVVGYSKHMEKDENQTLKSFEGCNKILEKLLIKYGGSVFNTAGDSVLAEFPSAVAAVECGSDFQKEIKKRNASIDTSVKLEFRIGINMGDVVKKSGNLLGDGVNIAARLEALSQSNGISISKSVFDLVSNKTNLSFNDLGVQKVKDNEFHAFDVLLDPSQKRKLKTKSKSNVLLFTTIAVVLIIGLAGIVYYNSKVQVTDNNKTVLTADKPSVLVMPFENQTGKKGSDLILKVPTGTQVFEEDNNTLIFDFTKTGQKFVVANGGKSGLGNVRFKSSTNRAPRKITRGQLGEEFWIWLQLKIIADVGIIGLPNAGKSSLLASITSANPKIANYKFTTINPNLGVAMYDNKEITLADIPGLIEGAHTGVGLGIKFLKHVERCKTLLHLIDVSEEDLVNSYKQIRKELGEYSKELLKKKEIIVLNKVDLLSQKELKNKKMKFEEKLNKKVIQLSTFDKKLISNLKIKLLKNVS